jgi:hypothetical protein
MKTYGRVEVQLHEFLNSVLYGSGGQLHSAATSPALKQSARGWADPRGSLDAVEKRIELLFLSSADHTFVSVSTKVPKFRKI